MCRQRSPLTARSQSARTTRAGDGRKIGLISPVVVTSCQSPSSTRNAATLANVHCSTTKPPPRNASLRSRAAVLPATSDMGHELAVGHDRLLFDQRPEPLAKRGDGRVPLRLGSLGTRNRNV